MSHTSHTFKHAADALPGWVASSTRGYRCAEFRPVLAPIQRAEQLTIEQAMGSSFDVFAASDRKAPAKPVVDDSAGLTQGAAQSRLGAVVEEYGNSDWGLIKHVDIVEQKSTKGKPEDVAPVVKLGMDVWQHIDDELHRRRLNAAWFGRKLGVTRQVIGTWKTRGVPSKRYEQIAQLLGWSLDRLVSGIEPPAGPVAVETPMPDTTRPVSSDYSPMALDLARMLDGLPDEHQKRRAYALILQLLAMGEPSPTAPAPAPAAPAVSPTPGLHHGR